MTPQPTATAEPQGPTPFICLPARPFRLVWNYLAFVCAVFSLVWFPGASLFLGDGEDTASDTVNCERGQFRYFTPVAHVATVLGLLDILLFRTAYRTVDNKLVTRHSIARRYLCGWPSSTCSPTCRCGRRRSCEQWAFTLTEQCDASRVTCWSVASYVLRAAPARAGRGRAGAAAGGGRASTRRACLQGVDGDLADLALPRRLLVARADGVHRLAGPVVPEEEATLIAKTDGWVSKQYALAFFWAVATSMGSEAALLPVTPFEQIFSAVTIAIGWALISFSVGAATSIVSTFDLLQTKRKQEALLLEQYLHPRRLPRCASGSSNSSITSTAPPVVRGARHHRPAAPPIQLHLLIVTNRRLFTDVALFKSCEPEVVVVACA